MDKKNDLITGVVMALLSMGYLFEAAQVKVFSGMGKSIVNSGTIPKVWGGCLLFLSILLIIRALKGKKEKKAEGSVSWLEKMKENREVAVTFLLLLAYIGIMDFAGFVISSMLYIFLQAVILTPYEKRSYKMAALLSVAFSVGIYYVFVEWLMVLLPAGILAF